MAFPRRIAVAGGDDDEAAVLADQGDIIAQLWSFGRV